MAIDYAIYNFIKYKEFKPDWEKHGKCAGILRNIEMSDYAIRNGNGALLAFFDGKSKGTSHMIEISEKAGMNVRVVRI